MLSLSQNLRPAHCLKLIYYSHIYCHLSYGLGAWGSMISKGNINELFRIQKQCLCYACNLGQNASLEKEYPKRGIIKFPDMIRIELCKLSHKITINQVPKPLRSIMKIRGGKKLHKYNARHKNTPNVQFHGSTIFHQSYICRSVVEYNKLPNSIKELPYSSFMKGLKNYFL